MNKYERTYRDIADIRAYRKGQFFLVLLTTAFIGLVIGALIYGLYNASQIERAARNQCIIVHDATC